MACRLPYEDDDDDDDDDDDGDDDDDDDDEEIPSAQPQNDRIHLFSSDNEVNIATESKDDSFDIPSAQPQRDHSMYMAYCIPLAIQMLMMKVIVTVKSCQYISQMLTLTRNPRHILDK